MAARFLRKIDSNRFDIPEIHGWTKELAAQGNFRDCDSTGHLIKPGPQPWVDKYNHIHDPDEPKVESPVSMGQSAIPDANPRPTQSFGSIIHLGGIPCNHWIPNYILDEVARQDNQLDVIKAEVALNRCKFNDKPNMTFVEYLAEYKEARRCAYESMGKQNPDITEPKMIAKFYELHPNLRKHESVAKIKVEQPIEGNALVSPVKKTRKFSKAKMKAAAATLDISEAKPEPESEELLNALV